MSELKSIGFDFFSPFNEKACDLCGECFSKCPVLKLPLEESKEEMKRLLAGEKTNLVLSRCQSCFSCNFYCPNDARPASLILQRWNERYKKEGLKLRGRYFMTFHPHYPNFRSSVMKNRFRG